MIVKKYLVKSVDEVEQLIAQDLGPKAVILTSRHIRYSGLKSLFFSNKLEVIAAADENDFQEFEREKREKEETWESPIQMLEESQDSANHLSGLEEPQIYEPSKIPGTYLDPRFNRKAPYEGFEEGGGKESYYNLTKDLLSHFAHLTKSQKAWENEPYATSDEKLHSLIHKEVINRNERETLADRLEIQGIDPVISKKVSEVVLEKGVLTEDELWPTVQKEIATLIRVTGPITLTKNQQIIVGIIGLNGSGKTLALFEIARQYEEQGISTAILIQQPRHIGNVESATALAAHHGISLSFFRDQNELSTLLNERKNFSLVFIEPRGHSLESAETLQESLDLLRSVEGIQIYWLVESCTKQEDALIVFDLLADMKVHSLLFTKLGHTVLKGSLLNIIVKTGLPVSYLLNDGQIAVAEPFAMANLILSVPDRIPS